MLYLTSFLFAIPCILAFYHRFTCIATILLGQYGLSILHHSHYANGGFLGDKYIAFLDRSFAHAMCLYVLYHSYEVNTFIQKMNVILTFYIIFVYLYAIKPCVYQRGIVCTTMKHHAMLHIIAAMGTTMVIVDKKNTSSQ